MKVLYVFLAAILTAASVFGMPPQVQGSNPTLAERYASLVKDYSAESDALPPSSDGKSLDELKEFYAQRRALNARFSERFWGLAEDAGSDSHVVLDCIGWILRHDERGSYSENAIGRLSGVLVDSPETRKLLASFIHEEGTPFNHRPLFEAVLAKSTVRETKGVAALGLAQTLMEEADFAPMVLGDQAEYLEFIFGKAYFAYLKTLDPEAAKATAIEQLKTITVKYADVRLGEAKLGDLASVTLAAAQASFNVGSVAPDIVGTDLDGEAFKLSDYRGKVVVLDFWGNW